MDNLLIGFRHVTFESGADIPPRGILEYVCKTKDTEFAMRAIAALVTYKMMIYQDIDGKIIVECLPSDTNQSEAVLERLAQIGSA